MGLREISERRTAWPRAAGPIAGTVAFIAVIVAGCAVLWRHEQTAGVGDAPPAVWPSDSRLPVAFGRARVVLFLHPRCPCSRASLSELERVMARFGNAGALAVFYHPTSLPRDWTETDAWRHACRIPGVTAFADDDGDETRRFHGATSGMTLVYDGDGDLLFAGGITPSRGHEGSNAGTDALCAVFSGRTVITPTTRVYGCPILPRIHPPGRGAE